MFTWLATRARTGEVIADFPDLEVSSVKKSLGRYEPAPISLPLPSAPENWLDATVPGGCNLHLLVDNPDDPSHGIPVWGGLILARQRTEGDMVSLTTATVEAYTDRRFLRDVRYDQVGQNDIIADIVTRWVLGDSGIPIRVEYTTPGVGKLRDREYKDQDDKTAYSAITDLMGVIDGPEWNVEWEWQSSPERITPVLYVGDRIGRAVPTNLGPASTFEMPGPVSSFAMLEDYTDGKGANSATATSSGQGDTRPQSAPQLFNDPFRPRFEFRWSPSSSITQIPTLTDYASKAATSLGPGTNSLTLSADYFTAPKLGVDWNLGDDVGYKIGGVDENGADTVPAFPGGTEGVARAIGWELTLSNTPTITPILSVPSFS